MNSCIYYLNITITLILVYNCLCFNYSVMVLFLNILNITSGSFEGFLVEEDLNLKFDRF